MVGKDVVNACPLPSSVWARRRWPAAHAGGGEAIAWKAVLIGLFTMLYMLVPLLAMAQSIPYRDRTPDPVSLIPTSLNNTGKGIVVRRDDRERTRPDRYGSASPAVAPPEARADQPRNAASADFGPFDSDNVVDSHAILGRAAGTGVSAVDAETGLADPAVAAEAAAVRGLQERLNALGYDAGPVDGLLGPKTREAIDAFRRAEGLDDAVAAPAELLALTKVSTTVAKPKLAPVIDSIGALTEPNGNPGATGPGLPIAASTNLPKGGSLAASGNAARPEDPRRPAPLAAAEPLLRPAPLDALALIGGTLINRKGMKVGEIRNVLFERTGEVTGLVVRVGGFRLLGDVFSRWIGEPGRDIAVSWSKLRVDLRGRVLTDMSWDDAEQVPTYETPVETAAAWWPF